MATQTPDQTTKPDHQTGPDQTWSTRLHNHASLIPWAAGLAAAGYYQADLAHQTLQWTYPWALVFPLAIECGIAWSAGNLYRRLVNRDTAIAARLGFYGLIAFSCSLLFWHARTEGRPLGSAIAISALSLIAAWVWTQRTTLQRRALMRAKNLVYPAIPNYPVYRWLLCPLETWGAMRHGVRNAIEDPIEALHAYRTSQVTPADRTVQTTKPIAPDPVQTTIPDPTPSPAKPKPDRTPKTDQTEIAIDDMVYISAIRQHPDWPRTSLNQVTDVVAGIDPTNSCGRSRAIRLRGLALQKAEV